ncbi:hypothetical protein SO802_028941 [Lithocarpus litseifolius]|uniref:DUF4218 domain-containing protein n=1 Tax=Lithocarpus litseifolius TaxID=425828 RepID=A0AAW2BTW9_9ROSI
MKCLNSWTNKSFITLLQFFLDFLTSNAKFPKDCYEAKKIIKDLGLSYEKIRACPKDCILYWKENANLEACPNCNRSRWESNESKGQQSTNASSKKRKKKVVKILRWFPLKPRLQRLFMSPKTANHMKWHVNGRVNDKLLRHHADYEAWKSFDSKYIEFSSGPRNVRLGLAADGFNSYGNMSSIHSWSTKGALACPPCNYDSQSPPITVFGGEIMLRMDVVANHVFRKKTVNLPNERKRREEALTMWKKRSIFFTLPYWEDHVLRHNLDVMHIEENVVDNIIGTFLNLDGKTENNLKARQDLKDMGIRSEFHLEKDGNDQKHMPHACYYMNASEKDSFLHVLKDLRVQDGYSSNISPCIKLKECKISVMKSHDNHILMQYLSRLKSYVHNKTYPKDSIAEGYIVEECLAFSLRYFKSVETAFNRFVRNVEESMSAVMLVDDIGDVTITNDGATILKML